MKTSRAGEHDLCSSAHHDVYSRTVFGFWVYLLTDFILFGTLFATYAVLRKSTFGGPSAHDLFDLSSVLSRSLLLILCSFMVGLGGAAAHRHNKLWTVGMFALTGVLGILFIAIQYGELHSLIVGGNSWRESAFLSAYFTLLGTFLAHMIFALLWIFVLIIPVGFHGITEVDVRRLTCLRMFWQFLSIVWVFIYTFVYLIGSK